MHGDQRRGRGGVNGGLRAVATLCAAIMSCSVALALGPSNLLILVNEDSATSIYIARMYRQYYPQITDSQVLYLSGLADCTTAAEEIITREQYEQHIAQLVRAYLADPNYPDRITQIKVIVTTAGMPYRIEDTTYSDAIYPAGSNPETVTQHESSIDAVSVESELTCLWYVDYNDSSFERRNRMVNSYQGYRNSPVSLFPWAVPGTKQMNWSLAISDLGTVDRPFMEGMRPPFTFFAGTVNRSFHVGDMYLTCRLDGPKDQGQSAVFAVRAMLERAKRASDPTKGVNPAAAVGVLDDAPTKLYDYNRTFNLNFGQNYWIFGQQYWDYDGIPSDPPDVPDVRVQDDYVQAYRQTTIMDPSEGILNIGYMPAGSNTCIMLDRRGAYRTTQADLDALAGADPNRNEEQGIIFLATFGYNGDEPAGDRVSDYLLVCGPNDGPLFNCVNGAVFTSVESLNAVTMFSDVSTSPVAQAKIVDFIEIGGAGAIGHSFEPQSDAAIDNEFLLYNLLADDDEDGFADLTFVEAAFTAIPYLSWSEVVIGDPLMRIAYGPGQKAWTYLQGDATNNGRVSSRDITTIKQALGGILSLASPVLFERYDDLCDVNKNGRVSSRDVTEALQNLGTMADW